MKFLVKRFSPKGDLEQLQRSTFKDQGLLMKVRLARSYGETYVEVEINSENGADAEFLQQLRRHKIISEVPSMDDWKKILTGALQKGIAAL